MRDLRGGTAVLGLALLFAGCPVPATDDDDASGDDDTSGDDDSTADDDDATGDDDDATGDDDDATGDDDTTAEDCEALPSGLLAHATLTDLYASEDFAFDDQGHLISHDANALFKQEYPPGAMTPFAVTAGGPGGPASMRMLPTGDLVYANVDTSTLYRVEPDGTTTVVYGGLGYPTGIDIHPDGMVFLADLMGVMRIDPYGGDMEVLIASNMLSYPNGLTFSANYDRLYIGTLQGIFAVDVDPDGSPSGVLGPWAASPDDRELLGMGVDICDNVYALHEGLRLLRYPPTGGDPEVLMELPGYGWLTNLQWGSGVGGWDDHTIYITDRNGNAPAYHAVPVGVPSKPY